MSSIVIYKQCTIKCAVRTTGITVHSGESAALEFFPAPVNTGVVFCVHTLGTVIKIPALSRFVGDTRLSTTLVRDGKKISTVEHLLSAIAGLGIDNLYIHLHAAEIPIMDGSAAPFVFLLQSAGIVEQEMPKRFVRIKKRIVVQDGDKIASVEPYHGLRITCEIDYAQTVIKKTKQYETLEFSTAAFIEEISRARTFGLLAEYEQIRAMHLARGASLDNAVVVDDSGVLNQGGLRYANEFVRHKILDALGDLYLLGGIVLGNFQGYKSGHTLNDKLVKAVLADADAWEFVTFENEQAAPPFFLWNTTSAAA